MLFCSKIKSTAATTTKNSDKKLKKALVLNYCFIVQFFFFTTFQSLNQYNLLESVINLKVDHLTELSFWVLCYTAHYQITAAFAFKICDEVQINQSINQSINQLYLPSNLQFSTEIKLSFNAEKI